MAFPKDAEQVVVADPRGIEKDAHDFGVSGRAGAHFFVRRVGREAASVPHRRTHDTRRLPEHFLGAPEAAEAEERFAQATVTRLERRAVDEMRGRDAQRLRPPGKSLFTGWKLQFEGL